MTAATPARPETVRPKTDRDENFPVASLVLSRAKRGPVLAFYRFVRAADDVADAPDLPPEEKLARLDAMERALVAGEATLPEAAALHAVAARYGAGLDGGASPARRLPAGCHQDALRRLGGASRLLRPLRRPCRALPAPPPRRGGGGRRPRRRALHRPPDPQPPSGPQARPRPPRPHLPPRSLDGAGRRRGRLLRARQRIRPPRRARRRPRPGGRAGRHGPRAARPPPRPPPRRPERGDDRPRRSLEPASASGRSDPDPGRGDEARLRARLRRGASAARPARRGRDPAGRRRLGLVVPSRDAAPRAGAPPRHPRRLRLLPRHRRHRRRGRAGGGEAPLPRRLAAGGRPPRRRPRDPDRPRARLGHAPLRPRPRASFTRSSTA